MRIDFDEATHTYTLDGVGVPSVTEIINGALDGARKPRYPAGSAERGRNVHLACEFDDMDDLDDETLDPSLRGYVEGWRAFKAEYAPRFVGVEAMVGSMVYEYAGTLDRLCALPTLGGVLALLDIKSGRESVKHALQTAGYALAYEEMAGVVVQRRGCVYLTSDGEFTVRWHEHDGDVHAFIAARTLYNWRRRCAA